MGKKVCIGIIVLVVLFNIPSILGFCLNAFNIFYPGPVSGKEMEQIQETAIEQFANNKQIFMEVAEKVKDFPEFSGCSKTSNDLPESAIRDKELMSKIYFILNDLDFNEISLRGSSDDLNQRVYFEKSKQFKFNGGIYYLIKEDSASESLGVRQVKIDDRWGYVEYLYY